MTPINANTFLQLVVIAAFRKRETGREYLVNPNRQ